MTDGGAGAPEREPGDPRPHAATPPAAPLYRGEPLDAERGPGLGCFWSQVVVLAFLLVLTPIGVANGWAIWLTGGMLVLTIVLLLLAGQTVIFLLRLVAADRRTRRRPLRGATPTVGELDDRVEAPGEDAERPETSAGDDATGRDSAGVRQ